MNHKLAVAYAAKKMSGKKSKDMVNLDHLKGKCLDDSEGYADGGQVKEVDPVKAAKFQKGFGFDKPVGNETVDDKIKNWIASKMEMKSQGGMIGAAEDLMENYQEAPDWGLNEDFLTADQGHDQDDDEPMKRKRLIKSMIARIAKDHME